MEIAGLGIDAFLLAPARKGPVQELVRSLQMQLHLQRFSVDHMQLHHDIAALNDVQLLTADLAVAVLGSRVRKPAAFRVGRYSGLTVSRAREMP